MGYTVTTEQNVSHVRRTYLVRLLLAEDRLGVPNVSDEEAVIQAHSCHCCAARCVPCLRRPLQKLLVHSAQHSL